MSGFAWMQARRDSVYFFLVGVFLFGLACSKIAMSASFLCYALFFLLFGNKPLFWTRWHNNRLLIGSLLFFWGIHALSLFWSEDLFSGWNGLRVRLSMVAFPILLITTFPWEKHRISMLMKGLFVLLSVLMALNLVHYLTLLRQQSFMDIRQLSWFGSHIRFGILVAFSTALCMHLMKANFLNKKLAWGYVLLASCYVLYSQTFSAILGLFLVYVVHIGLFLWRSKWSKGVLMVTIAVSIIAGWMVLSDFIAPLKQCGSFENVEEAAKAWSKKSTLSFYGKDKKNQALQSTCERYLCSMDKTIDPESLGSLPKACVKDIENGFTDQHSAKGGLLGRYNELKYETQLAKDPNGHSYLQRVVYWKTALQIIVKYPLFGVGIGDVDSALKKAYLTTPLLPEFQKRPHNMFLTTGVSCGILGIIGLLFIMVLMSLLGVKNASWVLLLFVLISFCTMLLEDSLETQAGSSFFGFFIGFLACKEVLPLWSLKND